MMLGINEDDKIEAGEDQKKVEYTQLGFWEATIKNNYRRLGTGIVALILLSITLYYEAYLVGLAVFSFSMSFTVAYFFWQSIQEVPKTVVVQTDLDDRLDNIVQIPNSKLAEFEIEGNPDFFSDQAGNRIIHADKLDLENEEIKCAWSHEVSNYKLSIINEAFQQAKKIARDNIKENAKYKHNTREMALQYANNLLEETLMSGLENLDKTDEQMEEEFENLPDGGITKEDLLKVGANDEK